ncbi:hypothetical protein K439DRAFT_1656071 [Ramaria rubella]|nr:hypothetical protein K439DRAFT_1656071 [Ramaria rubella]
MSAHSFPSLTSDSSSFSRSSDLHELPHERLFPASLTPNSTISSRVAPQTPQNSEISQLRTRVSKLEQGRFVLGDYAAELQSRIRQLERERMERTSINGSRDPQLVGLAEHKLSNVPSTLSRPSSPTSHNCEAESNHTLLRRSSLSVATSQTVARALTRAPPSATPSPTASQLAFPVSTNKTKLVPKRNSLMEVYEIASTLPKSSVGQSDRQYESMTPTRQRLQAMYGAVSADASSQSFLDGERPSKLFADDRGRDHVYQSHSMRSSSSKTTPYDKACHSERKRTTFTSKLDSIVLTSKLFPLSSSRSKTPLTPEHRSPTSVTAVIPLACSPPPSTSNNGNILLDSPPHKNVKVQLARRNLNALSQSLGLEENRHNEQPVNNERKTNHRSRGRVSFSDRLFSPSLDRGEDTEPEPERTGTVWGSWGRKKHPPPLSFGKEKSSSRPSTPPSAFPAHFSKSEDLTGSPDARRKGKRRSLAAGCLRSLVPGSSDKAKAPLEERPERRVLRRSLSETRRSGSRSRSQSRQGVLPQNGDAQALHGNVGGKDEKRRITPSRVGSPMPKGRIPEMQDAELERTNSMRSAGKWGHRGRGFSTELTRRRTIHPMFSFERPGSSAATSTSSSRRNGVRTGVEEPENDVRGVMASKLPRPVAIASPQPSGLVPYELEASHSQMTHTQDHSYASGHTTGPARSEHGSTSKSPMMRTRFGMQSHGTFAFEPAAAVVCPPRSAPPTDAGRSFLPDMKQGGGSLSVKPGRGPVRSLSTATGHGKSRSEPSKPSATHNGLDLKEREYLQFCQELKVIFGDGEDWSLFKKYVRRFDLGVLSAEVLVQRVKNLIDGHRSVDGATRLKLHERFAQIVYDNLHE